MTLVFGLFSALLALLTMRILGTPELDPYAYLGGIAFAGLVGVGVAMAVRRAQARPRLRGISWLLVPLSGGVVGMAVQTIILVRSPFDRPILLAVGLSTFEPERWILVGLPMGAIPALVATAVLGLGMRSIGASADAKERMTVPFAGACALFAASALALVQLAELPAVVMLLAVAVGALGQVLSSDRTRAHWLAGVFAGSDAAYEVVPIEACPAATELPAAVGAVFPSAAIVRFAEASSYRGTAREPFASTSISEAEATLPLRRRRQLVLFLLAATTLATGVAILARTATIGTTAVL